MNTQIDMSTFHEMLKNEEANSLLMQTLKKLTSINDPKSIAKVAGPQPLGSWSGWSF